MALPLAALVIPTLISGGIGLASQVIGGIQTAKAQKEANAQNEKFQKSLMAYMGSAQQQNGAMANAVIGSSGLPMGPAGPGGFPPGMA